MILLVDNGSILFGITSVRQKSNALVYVLTCYIGCNLNYTVNFY